MSESSVPEDRAAAEIPLNPPIAASLRSDLWPWAAMGLILVWATVQLRFRGRACGAALLPPEGQRGALRRP
jgi:hypothetical protein